MVSCAAAGAGSTTSDVGAAVSALPVGMEGPSTRPDLWPCHGRIGFCAGVDGIGHSAEGKGFVVAFSVCRIFFFLGLLQLRWLFLLFNFILIAKFQAFGNSVPHS